MRAWASVHHGFTRRPGDLVGVSETLARVHVASVRPAIAGLSRRRSIHDLPFLVEQALLRDRQARVRWPQAAEVGWLGVGHSAGAAAALVEAAARRSAGLPVLGVICIDGTDTAGGVAAAVMESLAGVDVRFVGAPASRCNAGLRLLTTLAPLEPIVRIIRGSGHGDAERIGRVDPAPARLYAWACGDESGPEEVAALEATLLAWVEGLVAGVRF